MSAQENGTGNHTAGYQWILHHFRTFAPPKFNRSVTLQLELSASKTVNLEVVNAIGQVVLMRTSTIDGQTAIQLDLSDQPKGIYFLRATGNSEQLFERIVLQ